MGRMLGLLRGRMIEALEGIGNIVWHANVDMVVDVVPLERESHEDGAGPVDGDGVFFLKDRDEVFGVVLVGVANAEIINNQAESDGIGVMVEEAWGVGALVVTMEGQVLHQGLIGEDTSLGKAIHTLADFYKDGVVVADGVEMVMVDDGLGKEAERDPEVFVVGHGCVEVEVFDVKG
jgi:hypothetical protein